MEQPSGNAKSERRGQVDEKLMEELRQTFEAQAAEPSDLHFEREDGKLLDAFVNGNRAWLLYRQDENDAGFSSRDPDYTGSRDAVLPYILSNGQQDEYPVAWTIVLDEAVRAVAYFLRTGEKAPWVTWHDDYFPQERIQWRGKFLDVLANDDRAWLRYHRSEDDPGLTAYSPQSIDLEEIPYEFVLDNGQRVAHPLSQTLSKEEASRVYHYFLHTGEKDPSIDWRNEI